MAERAGSVTAALETILVEALVADQIGAPASQRSLERYYSIADEASAQDLPGSSVLSVQTASQKFGSPDLKVEAHADENSASPLLRPTGADYNRIVYRPEARVVKSAEHMLAGRSFVATS